MMRIVCPTCGEEPVKGQRHVCKPVPVPAGLGISTSGGACGSGSIPTSLAVEKVSQFGGARRGVVASAGAVCASIASLVSKNPGLWRSNKALARCSGEDFVAGLLATAVGLPGWHRDPKRTLLCALAGRVADEAARALQEFWRQRLSARALQRQPLKVVNGYQQLVLRGDAAERPRIAQCSVQKNSMALPTATARLGDRKNSRGRPPDLMLPPAPVGGGASPSAPSSGGGPPPSLPSPRQPETPRNKSNPRPAGVRAVPINPIQALKQRREQQQLDAEEKRIQQLLDAERARCQREGRSDDAASVEAAATSPVVALPELTGAIQDSSGVSPSSDSGNKTMLPIADTHECESFPMRPSAPSTPRSRPPAPPVGGEEFMHTPGERRQLGKPPGSQLAIVPAPAAEACGESSSAPATLEGWRRKTGAAEETPRASSATGQAPSPGSATQRLQERMRQRSTSNNGAPKVRCSTDTASAASDWRDRIESRKHETEVLEAKETEHKQRVEERASKRNDAMRRVMERQAQRQQCAIQLEE